MNNLYLFHELEKLLRDESRYCSEDGILLKNAVVEAALAVRPELIKLLLTHEGLKANFFTDVDGLLVFDKVKFQKFVMNKRFLPDSYTSYKNKIGLTGDDDRFLSESREVVLSWPYKDCVLEGGSDQGGCEARRGILERNPRARRNQPPHRAESPHQLPALRQQRRRHTDRGLIARQHHHQGQQLADASLVAKKISRKG